MTRIKAFKAIRPVRDKAHLVACRSATNYNQSVLEVKLETNPYTFIHIIHPELSENDGNRTAPNSEERFAKVKAKYLDFFARKILKQDEEESIYVYRQSNPHHSYLGVIGGASVQEYKDNKIKKHEATLASREEMFTNYLSIVGYNAEPVLLCHRKSEELNTVLAEIVKKRPEYEFTTTDEITHELWLANKKEVEAIQVAYEKIDTCYIADGHHRSSSSVQLYEQMRKRPDFDSSKNYNYFLSFFIDEERLNIMAFNRLCKSLNDYSKEELIVKIEEFFTVDKIHTPYYPEQLHDIHLYLESEWYRMRLKTEKHKKIDAVSEIDAEILTKYILSPILNIKDLTRDENIDFQSGENSIEKIEELVDSGKFKLGFMLFPVTMSQLKAVADENAIMPPKSTWIEPKMRSGLTILKINE